MSVPAPTVDAQLKKTRNTNPNAASYKHANQSPTTRGRDKEAIVLAWLGVFGFTTTATVKKLLSIKSDGYLPQLQRAGLVQCRPVGKMAEKVWTLTNPKGREAAERLLGWHANRVRADRVNVSIATHEELGQRATRIFLQRHQGISVNEIRKLFTERDLRRKGVAAPDVVYEDYTPAGGVGWLAFEIETSPKGDPELRSKMCRLIELAVRQQRCERLHVQWFIEGEEPVLARYSHLWGTTVGEVRRQLYQEAMPDEAKMEKVKEMAYPTCSVHPLPKLAR